MEELGIEYHKSIWICLPIVESVAYVAENGVKDDSSWSYTKSLEKAQTACLLRGPLFDRFLWLIR